VTCKKSVRARYVSTQQVLNQLAAQGWYDGVRRRLDDDRVMQLVSPSRTQPWAQSYKDRAERLLAEGRIHPGGRASVARAKASGAWGEAQRDVDALLVPDDLAAALAAHPPAAQEFADVPPSTRRNVLRWIASAKHPRRGSAGCC
jgi:uncharacterized protein YdeI (YjbR/CyaY-like superfamily)